MVILLKILSEFLTPYLKRSLLISFLLTVFCSLFDLLAVTSIIPFISFLNGESFESSSFSLFNLLPKIYSGEQNLYTTGIIFASSIIFASLLKVLFFKYNSYTTAKIGNHLSNLVFSGYIARDYEFHVQQNPNKFLLIITNQLDLTIKCIGLLLQLFLAAVSASLIIFFLISFNAKLSLLAILILSFFYWFVVINVRNKLSDQGESIRTLRQGQIKLTREATGGIRDIIINQSYKSYTDYFNNLDFGIRKRIANLEFIGNYPKSALEGIVISVIVTTLLIFNKAGIAANFAFIGAAAYAGQKLLPTLQMIYYSWTGIKSNEARIADVRNCLISCKKRDTEIPSSKKINFRNFNEIKLSNISYSYSKGSKRILNNCNISIKRGEKVGIIGKTGSGKSTLMDILMGLLNPTGGDFFIDDNLINQKYWDYYSSQWRKCISHVPQEVFLKNETILSNIIDKNFNKTSTNKKKLEKVLDVANVNQFLPSLDKDINTFVGDRGIRLSGGQKQRIGIAKALIRNKPILFLDEGTSSLDEKTEKEILQKIREAFPLLTIFMITHKKSNLKYCDRVLSLSKGIVREIKNPY